MEIAKEFKRNRKIMKNLLKNVDNYGKRGSGKLSELFNRE